MKKIFLIIMMIICCISVAACNKNNNNNNNNNADDEYKCNIQLNYNIFSFCGQYVFLVFYQGIIIAIFVLRIASFDLFFCTFCLILILYYYILI